MWDVSSRVVRVWAEYLANTLKYAPLTSDGGRYIKFVRLFEDVPSPLPGVIHIYKDTAENLLRSHIHRYVDTPDDVLIYHDATYPMNSRRSQKQIYDHEMTDGEHRELLELILSMRDYRHLISTYDNEIHSSYLKGWNQHRFNAMTRGGGWLKKWFIITIP